MDETPATPSLGSVLSAANAFTLDNAGLLLGLWAACGLPPQLVLLAVRMNSPLADKESLRRAMEASDWGALGPWALGGLVALVFGVVAHAAILTMAARALRGESTAPGEVLGAALKRVPALAAASLIVGLCLGAGMLALLVPGVFLMIRLSLTIPAVIAGGKGPMDSLRRSWRLTAGRFWDFVGYLAVMTALTMLASVLVFAAGAVLAIVGSRAAGVPGRETASLGFNALQFLVSGWTAAGLMKLYLDLDAVTPADAA